MFIIMNGRANRRCGFAAVYLANDYGSLRGCLKQALDSADTALKALDPIVH